MLTFDNIPFSHSDLLVFTAASIVLILSLKIFKRLVLSILKQKQHKLNFTRYYPILEIIIYMLYFTYMIDRLSTSNPVYAFGIFFILLCLTLWVSWYYIKTYFMGMLFKLNNRININDSIRFKTYEGRIIDLGARRILIEDDNGEQIFIPYEDLAKHTIVKHHPAQHILTHSFALRIPATKQNIDDRIQDLRSSLLSLPWISLKKTPIINIIDEDDNFQLYNITVYSPEKSYFYRIEKTIKQSYMHTEISTEHKTTNM